MSEAEIRALVARRSRALRERNAAAFLATYAPDAVIYDLAPPLAHGLEPAGVTAWLASWDGPVGSTTRDIAVAVADPFAAVHGLERLTGSQGGERRDIWLRFTLLLRRSAGGWRIMHEHVSVPFRKAGQLVAATDLVPPGPDEG
jgi:uncharacterized protein (TIGR02246 family)